MRPTSSCLSRRTFLQLAAAGAAAAVLPGRLAAADAPGAVPAVARRGIKLGFDNFAVRACAWKAPQLIDYAASLKLDSLFITDLDAFENFDDAYLKGLRAKATDLGLQIHLGTWSICPTSTVFKKTWGTAEEHGALAIRVAQALGSPVARVVLGTGEDRKTPGGIEARIADMIATCQALKTRCVDANLKIAIENHAGDMQARELAGLIEAGGKDFLGVCLDSGNAVWTMEDPFSNLEILAPYVITTSLRDSMIWESPAGATVQWVAMGDGVVDFKAYFDYFAARCPGIPVHIETIGGFNRELPYLDPTYMKLWPKHASWELARFIALAKKGHPLAAGRGAFATDQDFQKDQVERSMTYCKNVLGLGLR
jgi:sugar phosphate isomerase/epimerase